MSKQLIVFDFDWSFVDQDTDRWVFEYLSTPLRRRLQDRKATGGSQCVPDDVYAPPAPAEPYADASLDTRRCRSCSLRDIRKRRSSRPSGRSLSFAPLLAYTAGTQADRSPSTRP